MYYLLQSWKDALSLFIPSNALLFGQVTLKSTVMAYFTTTYNAWWLFILCSALDSVIMHYVRSDLGFRLILFFAWTLMTFILFLSIRPSTKQKNFSYYTDYIKHFFVFLVISIIGTLIPLLIVYMVEHILFCASAIHSVCYLLVLPLSLVPAFISLFVTNTHLPIYISPLLTFTVLFYLDSRGNPGDIYHSMVRSLKMVIYNYPFCFIIFLLFTLISLGFQYLFIASGLITHPSFITIASYALLPIPLCILTNFYSKRMHDQFPLYYPETIKE